MLEPADLSANGHVVFKLLSADQPTYIDAHAEQSRLSVPLLTAPLLGLEMRAPYTAVPVQVFRQKALRMARENYSPSLV